MVKRSEIIDVNLSAHDQAVRLMAVWISAIADQVKNPVAGISAAASLIEKQMASFRASESWDPAIVEEAVRLMIVRLSRFDNYLSELSGFTREVRLEVQWWTVGEKWPSIEQAVTRKIPLDFTLQLHAPEGLRLYADFERFASIIAALTLNAAEACGPSVKPEIEIFMEPGSSPRGVKIRFEDNGPGFSGLALIDGLTPFFTTKDAGTGLGLAMIEKYVRAHGGAVHVSNRLKNEVVLGAVVELFFPYP